MYKYYGSRLFLSSLQFVMAIQQLSGVDP